MCHFPDHCLILSFCFTSITIKLMKLIEGTDAGAFGYLGLVVTTMYSVYVQVGLL